ncbi:MAG: DoxX family protein [Prevotellaceae bacterium]|jgi:uncharacterized membrane protein YphA (DoxX/SURF4 family)|nr:DoxX family protein [Prevotellaceae bacterium]
MKKEPNFVEKKLIQQEQAPVFRHFGRACRLIFGLTFIFSGFVKAIDPLGSTYKIQDYLHAMGLMQFDALALAAAIILSAVEFAIGMCVLSAIKLKLSTWGGLLFMLVMTPLTLWLAIANPVTDCGCFGDALVISNWATFWKNIVLLFLIVVIVYCNKYHRPYLSPLPSWLLSVLFFVIPSCFSFYCLQHLPIIDFRPYKIGNHIPTLMHMPADAERDVYETTFVYEKEGKQQQFTYENYPWNDSTWHFVDQTTVLVKKGYTPPIHDFTIESKEEGDITEDVLSDSNYVFLFVMYDLAKADTAPLAMLNALHNQLVIKGYRVMALTASPGRDIEAFKVEHGISYDFCTTDPITLKTIIRANPGVVVVRLGTVIDKWHANDTEERFQQFNKIYNVVD